MAALVRWAAVILVLLVVACATPRGKTDDEKRSFVDAQMVATLESFYEARPQLRDDLTKAPGYAVFSNVNIKVLLLGTGHGYGVAQDANGKRTYMRMAQLGVGPGLGLTDLRLLFVFHDPRALRSFVESGFEFAGKAEAAATSGGTGVAAQASGAAGSSGASAGAASKLGDSMAGSTGRGVDVYRVTEAGLSLQAQVGGTKYWRDGKLN